MHLRTKKLVDPPLQLKLVGFFLALACAGFVLQTVLFHAALVELAEELPDGGRLVAALPELLVRNLLVTVAVFAPFVVVLGIVITNRIAGPVHRLRKHLAAVLRGEEPGDVHLRLGDDLQELSRLLNDALRERSAESTAAAPGDRRASDEAA